MKDLPVAFIFKIIDFNYVFKVFKPKDERDVVLLNHTKDQIRYWLEHNTENDNLISYFFAEADSSNKINFLKNKLINIRTDIS